MSVATTLVTVAAIVSESWTVWAKMAVCAGVLKSSAVMPIKATLVSTATTDTATTGGVGTGVGIGEGGTVVGIREGGDVGAGTGTAVGGAVFQTQYPELHTS